MSLMESLIAGFSALIIIALGYALFFGEHNTLARERNNAPQTHRCDAEQMLRVEKETKFWLDTSGYNSGYCYNTAIIRNCTKVAP